MPPQLEETSLFRQSLSKNAFSTIQRHSPPPLDVPSLIDLSRMNVPPLPDL